MSDNDIAEQVQAFAADLVASGWDELDALYEARRVIAERTGQDTSFFC